MQETMPTSDAFGPCSPRPFSYTPPLTRPLAAAHDHVRSRHRVIIIGNTPATNASKPALYKSMKLKWLLLPCCAKTAPVKKMPPRPAFEEEDDVEIIDNDDGLSLSGGSAISWSAAGYEQQPTLPGAIPDPADSRRLRVRALPPLKGTKPLKRCGELPPLEIIGTQLKPLPADGPATPVQQMVQPMSLPKPAKLSKRQRNKARKRANRARKEQLRLEKKAEALRKAETAKPAATTPKRPKRRIGFRSSAVAPVDDNVAEVEEVNAASISKRISNSPLRQDRSEQKRDLEMFISTGVQGKEAKKLAWAADEDVKQAADDIVVVDVDSDDDVERLLRSASVASEESSRLFTSEFEPDSSFPERFPPVTPDSVSEQALQVEDDAPADRCPSSTTFVVSFGNQRSFHRPTTANRLAVKKTAPMKEELQKKQKMAEIKRMKLHLQKLEKLVAKRQVPLPEIARPGTSYSKKRPPTRQQLDGKQGKAERRRKELEEEKLQKLQKLIGTPQGNAAKRPPTRQQLDEKQERAETRRKEIEQQKLEKLRVRQRNEDKMCAGMQQFMENAEQSQMDAAARREQNLSQLRTKCANHNQKVARAVRRQKFLQADREIFSPEPIECDHTFNTEMRSIFESGSEENVHASHSNASLEDDDSLVMYM